MSNDAVPTTAGGVRCPACGCRRLRVLNTWHKGCVTHRSRRCRRCGERVKTVERVEVGRPG